MTEKGKIMNTIKVPARFFDDHASRFESGQVIRQTNNYYFVNLTDEQRGELLADAEFYSDQSYVISQMGIEYLGLTKSAQATVRALQNWLAGA